MRGMGIRSDTLERYRFEGAVVVLTVKMACGRTEGGGVVGGGLCKGTLGKDGIIVWRRNGNGRAIWVKVCGWERG